MYNTIMDSKLLQSLLDQNVRMVVYKEENDPNTTESGPYRIQLGVFPIQPGDTVIIASGATLDGAIEDLSQADPTVLLKKEESE